MSAHGKAVARFVIGDLLSSIVWFPLWWYTTGLQKVIASAYRAIQYRVLSLGLRIWIKNFFVPMYGQTDFSGRMVSLFMRFVILIGRLIILAVEVLLAGLMIVAWVAAPIAFLLMAVINLLQAGGVRYG